MYFILPIWIFQILIVCLKKTFCTEILERGMIKFNVTSCDEVIAFAQFIKMMQDNTGESIADLNEILKIRGYDL